MPDISVFGVCEKQLACHSCAVHILNRYDSLNKPNENEIDVLSELGDLYRDNKTRMSCQISLNENNEGLIIEIPRSAFFIVSNNDDQDKIDKKL